MRRHVAALDGLRGIALLGVLFFHAKGALPGGYLGVDLFFVLSGFLITSILLAEQRDTGRIALSAFWVRRARRLFPALLSLMPAIAIYSRFFAQPGELQGLRGDALATLGYVANWRAIFSHKSYWELFTAPSPLEHTWSLSIEEQFYVIWPLVVMLLLRRYSHRSIRLLAIALIALSMATMMALFDPEKISRVYLGTDTRATGILAGALLATFISPTRANEFRASTVRKFDYLGFIAILGLGIAWWKLEGEDPFLYHGGFWLTEIAALVLITCAVMGPQSVIARALAFRPLTLIGTISYGLYLWHWPIDVFLTAERTHIHGVRLEIVHFLATFAIAIVSYRFLERPIRQHGVPFGRPLVMVPAAVAVAVFLIVRSTYARPLPPPPPPPPTPEIAPPDAITFQVMLLGDSTANSLGWGLRGVRMPGVAVENRGQDGCTMLADTCGGEKWVQHTNEVRPNATLVFLGGAFLHGLTIERRWRKACYRGWDSKFEGTLARRLGELGGYIGPTQEDAGETRHDTQVWAVTIPYPLGPYDSADFRSEVDCINASIRKAAAASPRVRVLDLADKLCPKGECQRELNGVVIRPDGVHYDIAGASDLSRWVLEQIQQRSPQVDP